VGIRSAVFRICRAQRSGQAVPLPSPRPLFPPLPSPPLSDDQYSLFFLRFVIRSQPLFFQVPDRDGVWKNVPGLPTRAYADDGAVLLPEGSGSPVGLIPVVGVIVPVVAVILLFLMIFIAMIRHKIAPQYPGEMPRFGLRQDISGGEDEYDDEEDEGEEDALCVEVAHVESHTAAMSHRRVVCSKGLAFGESQEMQLRTDFSGDDSLERAIAIACHNRDAGGCS
jgi:hypothetical protein